MLTAYFDDSGNYESTSAVIISGFVSTLDQWVRFQHDWNVVLGLPQFDLEHFHMKELRQGKGRFAKFKDNLALQADLFDRLLRVLRIRILKPFAGIILVDDYNRVKQDYQLELLGPPVVVAGMMAISRLMVWKQQNHPDDEIHIVVDQGMSHYGKLDDEVFKRYGFRVVPGVVSKTPPLQGCDFIAWEQHRAASRRVQGPVQEWSEYRRSFLAILERLGASEQDGVSWYFWGEAGMREACDVFGVPRRVAVSAQPEHDEVQS
jgi:hypothetical protein